MSTVFEAESWTDSKNPPIADDTEYKQNFYFGKDFDKMDTAHHQVARKDYHYVSETEAKNLFMLVPRNVLLPVDPIRLTREQETVLCKLIVNELNRFDPRELRDIFVECSQHDKELRGFCGVEILDKCLRRHKAFLSDTLRIVAAQFVDPNYQGKVNYEKVLSFIGSAIQMNERGQLDLGLSPQPKESKMESRPIDNARETKRSTEKQPKYYMQNGESYRTGSLHRDREFAKLLRMVEEELSKNTYTMDWTRWQNAFYERDRDRRETISAAQIKDICYDQKLPLSDSLINSILSLCEDNNRDGQYRWPSFLEFLSRVRPSNTGLPIPVSKRPLEYAKHYPEPVPNWPRTDADTEHRGISPRRDISPRRGENNPDTRFQEVSYGGRPAQQLQSPLRRNPSNSPVRPQLSVSENLYPNTARESYGDNQLQNSQQYPLENIGYYDDRHNSRDTYRYTNRDTYQTDNYYDGPKRSGGSFRSSDSPPSNALSRDEQIRLLSKQLKELETKYEITKEALSSNDLPWLDRYLKMAQALYNSDVLAKGSLPRKDVINIVNQYNIAFNLNLDMARANMLAISPENLDKSGNIILRSFLANLSADRVAYKA